VKNIVANAGCLPEGVRVFLFGSACYRECPNDIDLLFVYDASCLSPRSAYAALRPLMTEIENVVAVPVRSVVLSDNEARESRFIEEVEPIELRSTRNEMGT
jgi:hypothetical protein